MNNSELLKNIDSLTNANATLVASNTTMAESVVNYSGLIEENNQLKEELASGGSGGLPNEIEIGTRTYDGSVWSDDSLNVQVVNEYFNDIFNGKTITYNTRYNYTDKSGMASSGYMTKISDFMYKNLHDLECTVKTNHELFPEGTTLDYLLHSSTVNENVNIDVDTTGVKSLKNAFTNTTFKDNDVLKKTMSKFTELGQYENLDMFFYNAKLLDDSKMIVPAFTFNPKEKITYLKLNDFFNSYLLNQDFSEFDVDHVNALLDSAFSNSEYINLYDMQACMFTTDHYGNFNIATSSDKPLRIDFHNCIPLRFTEWSWDFVRPHLFSHRPKEKTYIEVLNYPVNIYFNQGSYYTSGYITNSSGDTMTNFTPIIIKKFRFVDNTVDASIYKPTTLKELRQNITCMFDANWAGDSLNDFLLNLPDATNSNGYSRTIQFGSTSEWDMMMDFTQQAPSEEALQHAADMGWTIVNNLYVDDSPYNY